MLDFLVERFPGITRQQWVVRIASALVLDDRGNAIDDDTPYHPHGHLHYYREVADERPVPFSEQLLFQDEHLLVVDKPHFLAVTPGGKYVQETLLVRLKQRLGLDQLQPIHRIDRETAGVVVFCLNNHERDAYHALFRDHSVTKIYEAIAPWRDALQGPVTRRSRLSVGGEFFRQTEVPGEPNSHTTVECIERLNDNLARYRLRPHTGQRHQLRVHMAALDAPIVNDPFYPTVRRGPDEPDDFDAPLQLWAREISFTDPITDQPRRFQSQLCALKTRR